MNIYIKQHLSYYSSHITDTKLDFRILILHLKLSNGLALLHCVAKLNDSCSEQCTVCE